VQNRDSGHFGRGVGGFAQSLRLAALTGAQYSLLWVMRICSDLDTPRIMPEARTLSASHGGLGVNEMPRSESRACLARADRNVAVGVSIA
jgi:hypothetical protein